jgi:hydroxymethylglutaryl-CoA lyase
VLDVSDALQFAGHFHDTQGHALANIEVCLDRAIRTFDSSIAGLGGCPFAPGAKGNVSTESVVALLEGCGLATGVDMDKLAEAAEFAETLRSVA